MTTLWFDCETYSECDLKAHGTHRYAEHPSTEITVVQWALDDGEPKVYDMVSGYQNKDDWDEVMDALSDSRVTIVAHNSAFDRTLLRHCWGIDIPPERWYDTMIQAMSHGLPGALEKIGAILKLNPDEAKDKRGKELIQLFCKPRPKSSTLGRATRETHPTEWQEFLEYSRQDIVAMRAISKKLPTWNYKPGSPEHKLWHLDQRINDRGFQVDVQLADAAVAAVAVEQKRLKAEIVEQTDGAVTNASRRDQLLAYILAEYGVELPDMRADTLRRRLEDPELPEGVKLLLSIRLEATKTSTAKYGALLKATSADGRLRNTAQFMGAMRTGRWAHRLFQPGNMPRSSPGFDAEMQEEVIELLKHDALDLYYQDVMQQVSNCIRGCIVAGPGKKLVVADLSNIEGRGLAFLAGESWKLKAFRDFDAKVGPDLYIAAYARSFNLDPKTIGKKDPRRQVGKVLELAMGYQGGVAAFITFAAVYGMDLEALADAVYATAPVEALQNAQGMWKWAGKKKRTLGLPERVYVACEVLKTAWREAHPQTTALWAAADDSVREAIRNPGQTYPIGEHLKVRVDGAWMRMRLPSGRYLCYLEPRVSDDGEISYAGVNQYTRSWSRIKTYGGKTVEQATQAFARDILAYSIPAAEEAGYLTEATIHDELVTETPDTPEYSSESLAEIIAAGHPWAPGIPLAAAGFEAYRYRKD